MKKALIALATLSAASLASAQVTILLEDFEDSTVGYTTSTAEFTDGSGDFFTRTDGSDTSESYGNIQGDYYFAAMDLDGDGEAPVQTMTFSGIDVSDYFLGYDFTFSAFFAEADDGTNQDWDNSDYFLAEVSFDNGSNYTPLFALENDGSTFNSAPFVDTDFDGTGDGAEITSDFTQYSVGFNATGPTMDVRLTFALNSGDEDLAIDNLMITAMDGGTSAIPEPSALGLLVGLAAMAGMVRRRR